jgi:DNA-3-methyladenine glycosylase II
MIIFESFYYATQPMINIVNQNDIDQLLKLDDVFTKIHTLYGPPPDWQRPEGFNSLVRIILEQQVSLQSANAHFKKLDSYLTEFTPGEILKLSDEEMRNCQISRQKSTYIRELSTALLGQKIDLENLRQLPETGIRQQLKAIKGIGDWTANIYLMFCLQAKDIFPAGDIAILHTIKELTSAITYEEIINHSDHWKPYRSLASYFLWHYYLRKRNR